jgi:hypothetical protein
MSETVAVALITAGSALFVGTVGSLTTYFVSRRQSQSAVATADRQAHVELAKMSAENERLREEIRDEARKSRQGTYAQFLTALNAFEEVEFVSNLPDKRVQELWEGYRSARTALELVSSEGVRAALLGDPPEQRSGGLNKVLAEIRIESWGSRPVGRGERWQKEFRKRRIRFQGAQGRVIKAMRNDVTLGMFGAPPPPSDAADLDE